MTRIPFIILITLILSSCGTGMGIKKSNVKPIYNGFSAVVSNNSFKTEGRRYGDPTLLRLFESRQENIDSLYIYFNNNNELQLECIINGVRTAQSFKGKFSRRGYYEIYFSKEKLEIPPILPIIYSRNDINRIRLALTAEGDLLVDHKWDKSGNVFILAGGSVGRRQSFFKFRAGK